MKIRVYILLLMSLSLTTCQKDHLFDCFKSAGDATTENREATPFVNINLTDNVDLIIHPDTSYYIRVTAGENLIDGIITELSGNTLYIRNENRCNWVRSFSNTYTVEVGMDQPVNIHYDGSGNISCIDTIRTNDFTFDCFGGSGSIKFNINSPRIHLNNHIGRSDINAAGFTGDCGIYLNDVGVADASNLISDIANINNSSTGDCRLNVKSILNAQIHYSGNIIYKGNPSEINQTITGSGQLVHE